MEDVNESSMTAVCPKVEFGLETSSSAIQIGTNLSYDYPGFVAFLIAIRNIEGNPIKQVTFGYVFYICILKEKI